MKKNAPRVKGVFSKNPVKLFILVKLSLFLTISFQLAAFAKGFSQHERTTLKLQNVQLDQVFKAIELQTKYRFVYGAELLADINQPLSIEVNDKPVNDVLRQLLAGTDLSFRLYNEYLVVIQPKDDAAAQATYRRQQVVTGIVMDKDGDPLPSVTVQLKGQPGTQTLTDRNGVFHINAQVGQQLIISSVGYLTKELVVKISPDEPILQVNLESQINTLDETVVVGYGSIKRRDLTGSVASVNPKEFEDVPFTSIDQALTGKAAGVQVVQSDGSPGGVAKIRIRGGTSLMGGNDPLYIVDGVQVTIQNRYVESQAELVNPIERFGGDNPNSAVSGAFARGLNSLAGLNISDIESIDILKDASATAIYGSRAANGVVIITTKRGKKDQKPVLEANYYHGFSVETPVELLNRDQYIMIMREANKNLFDAMVASGTPITDAQRIDFDNRLNNPDYYGTANTDWLDLVTRTGQSDNLDVSVRGGGNASRYFISVGYNGTEGTVLGTDFRRLSGKINLDNEITDKLRIQGNFSVGHTTNNITNGLYTQALFAPPTYPAYNDDGSIYQYTASTLGGYDYEGFQNPLVLLNGINRARMSTLLGSVSGEYKLLPSLTFRSTASVNYNTTHQRNYVTGDALIASASGVSTSNLGTGSQSQDENTDLFFENTLTWDTQLSQNHRINAVAGTSWQKARYQVFGVTAQGYPDDELLNNLSSASLVTAAVGTSGQNSLLSFYLRANYAFKERYLFTFTGRSDASSKFPQNNRTGYFPSGGIAWRISDEPFLKNAAWLSELKIRASAGYTGTQNIGDNMFYTLYSPYAYGGVNALVPTQLGNENIKWESTLQKDAGLDIGLFNSRFVASIGVYEKNTSDILFTTPIASSSSFPSVIANLARIRNRGLEIDLRGTFISKPSFSWSGAYNMSFNRSLVTDVGRDFTDPTNPNEFSFGNAIIREGMPVGLLYGKVFEGIFETEEQVEAYKQMNPYYMYFTPYVGIGDPMFRMEEGDIVPPNDIIGYSEPKFYGGYTNTLSVKGISLITLFTFTYGGDVLYLGDIQNQAVGSRTNKTTEILKRWTPENPSETRPRLIYGYNSTNYNNSMAVYDASFFRLRTLTLTYQFPTALVRKWRIPQLSLYAAATNVFTLTSYPGADPEVSNDPYSLINGANDPGTYPAVRQYTLGLRFGL